MINTAYIIFIAIAGYVLGNKNGYDTGYAKAIKDMVKVKKEK